MTPKEKAKELITRFNFEYIGDSVTIFQTPEESKRCALIAVDEIIKVVGYNSESHIWMKVKQEIINQ